MRRETKAEREAWSAYFEGRVPGAPNKYNAERKGKYASIHEADVASKLGALATAGHICDLREQVRIELLPKNGKLRAVTYIADFTWVEGGNFVVGDAKGFKTPVYRLKKRLLAERGIEIREL